MLFAIRLEVSKATSMDSEYIILITNSLGSARKCYMQVYPSGNYIPKVLSSPNYTSLPFTAAINTETSTQCNRDYLTETLSIFYSRSLYIRLVVTL